MKLIEYQKLGISLSGGGAKGCFQAGALYYILTNYVINYHQDIDTVVGTSVGALNGAKVAEFGSGKTFVDSLKNIWFSIKSPKDILKKRFLGNFGVLLGADSTANSEPLKNLIKNNINSDLLRSSQIKFYCSAYNTRRKTIRYFTNSDPFLIDGILASCSIPGTFNPVEIYNDKWLDGGVREITPIEPLINNQCDLIIVIRCSASEEIPLLKHPSGMHLITSVLSTLINEIYNNDIEKFQFINQFINEYRSLIQELKDHGYYESDSIKLATAKLENVLDRYRFIDLIMVEPKMGELAVDTLGFNPKNIRGGFQFGIENAEYILKNYKIKKG